jgi:hypothetical protein
MFLVVFIILIFIIININAADQTKCAKWGNTFDVSLLSDNVELSCEVPGSTSRKPKVCCEAISNNNVINNRGIGESYINENDINRVKHRDKSVKDGSAQCEITKEYFPSPLELRDFEKSKEIDLLSQLDNFDLRLKTLLDYITSAETINNSSKWLARVKLHMSNENTPPITNDDENFLSRFHITRKCGDKIDSWNEWIEPLSIHARHPFGMGTCRNTQTHFTKGKPRVSRSNVDYVLLQSGKSLYDNSHNSNGRRIRSFPNPNSPSINRLQEEKHIMLDAGTSTFDSSLFWFTCGYSQRKIGFNQVYAWEMTLLEPTDYWSRVPPKWKPYWHFYNVPISPDSNHPDSPIRLIKQIATKNDFVSFKLDIDHPDTEMPVALSLLSDSSLSELIDEFFFELHFQCEVMTSCGWGKRVPPVSHGLKLDRSTVLKFFADLRYKGIRAHIWP